MLKQSIKQQIYTMAKNSKTDRQIANELDLDVSAIYELIHNLNNPTYRKYNPTLYNKIMFMRGIDNNDIIDKDYIRDIAQLVFQGFLFIEIAFLYNVTEKDIEYEVERLNKVSSPVYDPEYYWQIIKQKEKNEALPDQVLYQKLLVLKNKMGSLKKLSNSKRVIIFEKNYNIYQMIQEYLDSNMTLSDDYLSRKYSIAVRIVKNYLNGSDKKNLLIKLFGKNISEQILEHRRNHFLEIRKGCNSNLNILNRAPLQSNDSKTFEKIQKNISFWIHLMFEFKLSLEEFARLLNILNLPQLEYYLYSILDKDSLRYFFSYQTKSQGEHLHHAIKFLNELKILPKDSPDYKKLIRRLYDKDYIELLVKRKDSSKHYVLTDDDIRTIILYKIKYALQDTALPFKNAMLEKRCPEDLRAAFENVNNYYIDIKSSARSRYMGRWYQ